MKKFAQIQDGRVHWLFEQATFPDFHPSIKIIDVTSVGEIKEGYLYDEIRHVFYAPVVLDETLIPVSTPEEIQSKILMNTELLVMYKEFGL